MRKEHGLGLGRPCAAVAESRAQLGIFGREIGDVGQREILQLRKDHDLAREPSLHERAQSFGRGLHPADGPEGMARRQLAGDRKSTRLNQSPMYLVCRLLLEKKKKY